MREGWPHTMCRSCGAAITMAMTRTGKWMPIDPDPVPGGNVDMTRRGEVFHVEIVEPEWDVLRHTAHFATCPQANEWRRQR